MTEKKKFYSLQTSDPKKVFRYLRLNVIGLDSKNNQTILFSRCRVQHMNYINTFPASVAPQE